MKPPQGGVSKQGSGAEPQPPRGENFVFLCTVFYLKWSVFHSNLELISKLIRDIGIWLPAFLLYHPPGRTARSVGDVQDTRPPLHRRQVLCAHPVLEPSAPTHAREKRFSAVPSADAIGFYHLMEFTSDRPPPNLVPYFATEGPYLLSIGLVLLKLRRSTNVTEKPKSS